MRPRLPVLLLFPSCPSCSLPFPHYPDSCLPVPYFYLPVITQFPSCPFFPLYFTCPSFLRFPACPSLTLPFRHYQISCLPARLLLYLPVLYLPRPCLSFLSSYPSSSFPSPSSSAVGVVRIAVARGLSRDTKCLICPANAIAILF